MQNEVQRLTKRIPADLSQLSELGACLHTLFEQVYALSPSEEVVYNIELSVQEVAANIVQHAYAHSDGEIYVEIVLDKNPGQIVISLFDTGKSFEPDSVKLPELGSLQVHGYGLFLVHQLMDQVNYQTFACGNKWVLLKDLSFLSDQLLH